VDGEMETKRRWWEVDAQCVMADPMPDRPRRPTARRSPRSAASVVATVGDRAAPLARDARTGWLRTWLSKVNIAIGHGRQACQRDKTKTRGHVTKEKA
jgi:hypothetical protein